MNDLKPFYQYDGPRVHVAELVLDHMEDEDMPPELREWWKKIYDSLLEGI